MYYIGKSIGQANYLEPKLNPACQTGASWGKTVISVRRSQNAAVLNVLTDVGHKERSIENEIKLLG